MTKQLDKPAKLTMATAKMFLRDIGFSLSRRDGEYRLAHRDVTMPRAEGSAYYSDDLRDVCATAIDSFTRGHHGFAADADTAAEGLRALAYLVDAANEAR